jgi:hypothetical protein
MRYENLPDELQDAVDDLLEAPNFAETLQALDGAIAAGTAKERRRIAELVALRSEFEADPLRDQTIDAAIVTGGSAATTAPILEALGVEVVTEPAVDAITQRFDRAILNGTEPDEMEDV